LDSDQEKKWIEEGQKEINKMLGKKKRKRLLGKIGLPLFSET